MRIVFFMQDTGSVFGAERATLDLAHGLRTVGCRPIFFLIDELRLGGRESGLRTAVEAEGFPLHRFTVEGRLSRSLARRIRSKFNEVGGDVLHVIGYKANLHAWLGDIHPVVATVHGWLFRNDLKERLYDAIDLFALRRCDQVICLSRYYEDYLLRKSVLRERLVRIPSGLRDVPELAGASTPSRMKPTFGMLGRFSEEKNHELFLHAAHGLRRQFPEATFICAGTGPRAEAVKDLAASLHLGACMKFPGYKEVHAFMQTVDVYVICSRIENLPYSILEAMAWARPVIGTEVGGIPDLIVNGETGSLVPAGDVAALQKAMAIFCEQPALIETRGKAGRKRLLDHFTLDQSVAMHVDLYKRQITANRDAASG
ncbi:MAG: glycosyltransferase [Kiritimatiellae bacterium]|nr:glycosyltransferase [Kiritimatiellia bacterium]